MGRSQDCNLGVANSQTGEFKSLYAPVCLRSWFRLVIHDVFTARPTQKKTTIWLVMHSRVAYQHNYGEVEIECCKFTVYFFLKGIAGGFGHLLATPLLRPWSPTLSNEERQVQMVTGQGLCLCYIFQCLTLKNITQAQTLPCHHLNFVY